MVNKYTGAKKRAYVRALENLRANGLEERHTRVKMFIKVDKMAQETVETKPPRAIQYRAPEYNLKLSRYIQAIEEEYYPTLTYGTSSRVIAKGLNQIERAKLIIGKKLHYAQPLFLQLDHSAFDASISVQWLKETHAKYLKVCPFRKFHKLLKRQLLNIGETRSGIKYRIKGTRMSGDPDTALGNTIINLDAIYFVLTSSGITKFDMLVDGDDSIVIIEKEDYKLYQHQLFETLGFNTKISITDKLERAEFCQSRIVMTNPPKFVRNPCRAVSHAVCTPNTFHKDAYNWWLNAVGRCEISLNSGVPVLQALGQSLQSGQKELWTDELKERMRYEQLIGASPITPAARESFHRAWGIEPWLQCWLEETLLANRVLDLENSENAQSISRSRSGMERRVELSSSSWWCGCQSDSE